MLIYLNVEIVKIISFSRVICSNGIILNTRTLTRLARVKGQYGMQIIKTVNNNNEKQSEMEGK